LTFRLAGSERDLEEVGCRVFRQCIQRLTLSASDPLVVMKLTSIVPPFIANYLGIDVAVKEVLPSTDYDVAKYFEREWRLMKYGFDLPTIMNGTLTRL
jgi:hypothetical protein